MHSDRFCDVSEAYAAFLLRVGKSLHSLLLNSEYDEAHSYLTSGGTKGQAPCSIKSWDIQINVAAAPILNSVVQGEHKNTP